MNGDHRHSHVTGRSVYNIRTERLWRDVFIQVCHKYYNLFYEMEDEGMLDVENVHHVFAIQKVYLPIINKELETNRQGYNKHKLPTENGQSPEQLWTSGILSHINSVATPVQNHYGGPLRETFLVCEKLNINIRWKSTDWDFFSPGDKNEQFFKGYKGTLIWK